MKMGCSLRDLLWTLITLVVVTSVVAVSPELEVKYLGAGWKNITERINGTKGAYFSQKGDDLFLSCQAGYPIQWKISGVIAPPEIVKVLPGKRNLTESTFQIQLNIFFLDAENFTGLVASSLIACEEIANSENRDKVAVFVKGNVENTLLAPKNTLLEGNTTVIPCAITDPTARWSKPALYYKDVRGGKEVQIDSSKVNYQPTKGFQYVTPGSIFVSGTYTCRLGTEQVAVNVVGWGSQADGDTQFAPVANLVRSFSDEQIELRCASEKNPVSLKVLIEAEGRGKVELVNVTFSDKKKIIRLAVKKGEKAMETIFKGKAACVEETSNVGIHEWVWEFIPPPQLHLDNLEGEADCLSTFSPKRVDTVRCKNGMDCAFMKGQGCLGSNGTMCNFKKQKQFGADMDTHCWVEELGKGMECVSVPFSHLNGLVQCEVLGLRRDWEFFVGLDYKRYEYGYWENNVTMKALVQIEQITKEDGDLTGTGIQEGFVCKAASYLFADSLSFEVEYKNGSKIKIEPEVAESSNNALQRKPRKIMELYVEAALDKRRINLRDAIAVRCLAPLWNDVRLMKSTWFLGSGKRTAEVQSATQVPLELGSGAEVEAKKETFYIGDKNKRLNCSVEGDEEVEWYYKGSGNKLKVAKKLWPELLVEKDYLEFLQVEKKYAGEYYCAERSAETTETGTGQNDAEMIKIGHPNGNTKILTRYQLDVTAEPLSTSTTVYVGMTILILVIVGLAVAAFAVFAQKRNL